MTPEQKKDLEDMLKVSTLLMVEKYERGAVKHKGNLNDLSILQLNEEALEENTDQRFYLLKQRQKILAFKEHYGTHPDNSKQLGAE